MANDRSLGSKELQQTKNAEFVEAIKTRIFESDSIKKSNSLKDIAFYFNNGVSANAGIVKSGFFSTNYSAASEPSSIHCYPLHIAIEKNDAELAELLLNNGANPHLPNNEGVSSLELAVQKLNGDLVLTILNKLPPAKDKNAIISLNTIFSLCLSTHANITHKNRIIKKLLEMGVEANTAIEGPHQFALHHAALTNNRELVNTLFDFKVDPVRTDNNGMTAVEHAAVEDHWDIVLAILEKAGAQINVDALGNLLWLTSDITSPDIALEVVQGILTANPNACASKTNAANVTYIEWFALQNNWSKVNDILSHFRGRQDFDKVKLGKILSFALQANTKFSNFAAQTLLSMGVDANVSIQLNNRTIYPLHIAARRKDKALLEQLLKSGANPNQKESTQKTAIENLADAKEWELIPFFMTTAKVTLEPSSLGRVLWLAIGTGAEKSASTPILTDLLRAGANVNLLVEGQPSLFLAIEKADVALIKLLFYFGANPSMSNGAQESAVVFARKHNGLALRAYVEGTTFLYDLHKARACIMFFFSHEHSNNNIFFSLPFALRQAILDFAFGDLFNAFISGQEQTAIKVNRELLADKTKLENRLSSVKMILKFEKNYAEQMVNKMKEKEASLNHDIGEYLPIEQDLEIQPTDMKQLVVRAKNIRQECFEAGERKKLEEARLEVEQARVARLANGTHNGKAQHLRSDPASDLVELSDSELHNGHDVELDNLDTLDAAEIIEQQAFVETFKKIYSALLAGDGNNKNFLSDKTDMSAPELIKVIRVYSQANPKDEVRAAFLIAKEVYKDSKNCNPENVMLFWKIYKETFRRSHALAKSNILGTTYWRSSSLERDTEHLSEEQLALIKQSISEVDDEDTTRRAKIVRALKQ